MDEHVSHPVSSYIQFSFFVSTSHWWLVFPSANLLIKAVKIVVAWVLDRWWCVAQGKPKIMREIIPPDMRKKNHTDSQVPPSWRFYHWLSHQVKHFVCSSRCSLELWLLEVRRSAKAKWKNHLLWKRTKGKEVTSIMGLLTRWLYLITWVYSRFIHISWCLNAWLGSLKKNMDLLIEILVPSGTLG